MTARPLDDPTQKLKASMLSKCDQKESPPISMTEGLEKLATCLCFKRRFRWTFELKDGEEFLMKPEFVKSISKLMCRENNLTKKMEWEPLTVTYYEIADSEEYGAIYDYLADLYDGKRSHTVQGRLTYYNGQGEELDYWNLTLEVQSLSFGEFLYSTSDECTIELRFWIRKADHFFTKHGPPLTAKNVSGE